MSDQSTVSPYDDPELGATQRGLITSARELARQRNEALAFYQRERDVREQALAAPDDNTPIEFEAENGEMVTLPASQILALPRFSEATISSLQRGVVSPYEVADLDPLEVAARARAGQLQQNYIQDLKDARTQFDDADLQFDAAGTTLGSAASLLTDEDSELADAFTGLDSAGTLLTDETGQLQKGFTGLDAAGNLLTDETGELAAAFKGLTDKTGQIEGAFTDLGDARSRMKARRDRPDEYQTEARDELRSALTSAKTPTTEGIASLKNLITSMEGVGTTGAEGIRKAYTDAKPSLTSAQAQLAGQALYGRTGAEEAARRARASTAAAQEALEAAGIYGLDQAKAAAAALGGTGAQFDPSGIAAFYSPYQQDVIEKTLADIRREGDIAQQAARARAVQAGAFGGSREGVQLSEMERAVLEQQAQTAAQMRDAGYRQAAAQAQEAFERQQARQQSLAQLTGGLGQAGAATRAQAAREAGGLALSAEELAQRGALQAAGVGLQEGDILGRMGATYGQLQQAGEEAALRGQLAAQTAAAQAAAQRAGLGQSLGELQMRQGQAMGQLGLGYGQLGQADIATARDLARTRGDMGFQQSQMMAEQAARRAQLGLDQSQMTAAQAAQRGQLGIQQAQALGQLGAQQGALGGQRSLGGLRQASIGELESKLGTQEMSNLASMGSLGRTQQQALLEADRLNTAQEQQLPYQQIGFATDVLAKAPSGTSTTQNVVPIGTSPFQQIAGLGIGALSGLAGAKRLNLF